MSPKPIPPLPSGYRLARAGEVIVGHVKLRSWGGDYWFDSVMEKFIMNKSVVGGVAVKDDNPQMDLFE